MTGEGEELLSVGEIASPELCLNTLLADPLKVDGVVHSVKGCAEVKQQQDVEGARVCRGEVIIAHDFDKGSFSVEGWAETKSKSFHLESPATPTLLCLFWVQPQ